MSPRLHVPASIRSVGTWSLSSAPYVTSSPSPVAPSPSTLTVSPATDSQSDILRAYEAKPVCHRGDRSRARGSGGSRVTEGGGAGAGALARRHPARGIPASRPRLARPFLRNVPRLSAQHLVLHVPTLQPAGARGRVRARPRLRGLHALEPAGLARAGRPQIRCDAAHRAQPG